jgi:hypothetical protein
VGSEVSDFRGSSKGRAVNLNTGDWIVSLKDRSVIGKLKFSATRGEMGKVTNFLKKLSVSDGPYYRLQS